MAKIGPKGESKGQKKCPGFSSVAKIGCKGESGSGLRYKGDPRSALHQCV